MFRLACAAALLCLTACGQSASNNAVALNAVASSNVVAAPVAAPPSEPVQTPVPVSHDWSFYAHAGSGELFFGDGNWSEGDFLASFTCLPGSGQASLSLQGEPDMPAQLSSGDDSVAVTNGFALPVDHPVLSAFVAHGSIKIVASGAERDLAGKPGLGRIAVESFFAYCAAG